jgi:hypothetical protein
MVCTHAYYFGRLLPSGRTPFDSGQVHNGCARMVALSFNPRGSQSCRRNNLLLPNVARREMRKLVHSEIPSDRITSPAPPHNRRRSFKCSSLSHNLPGLTVSSRQATPQLMESSEELQQCELTALKSIHADDLVESRDAFPSSLANVIYRLAAMLRAHGEDARSKGKKKLSSRRATDSAGG